MMTTSFVRWPGFAIAFTLVGFLGACSDDGNTDQGYYDGEASAHLGSTLNQARCATCHSADGTQAGRAGNTLKDIAYHTSFKGGAAAHLIDGVNACVTGWMGGTALTADDPRYIALESYLQSLSSPSATTPNEIAPEVLADEAAYQAAYSGGDAAAGEPKFKAECSGCHGESLQVGPARAPSIDTLAGDTVGRIAQQVRTSGPPPSGTADSTDKTPGPMPFFEPKDLSAQNLKDIIAYVKSR